MRMIQEQTFSFAAIEASLARLRLDQDNVDAAIRRTVAGMARKIDARPVSVPAKRRGRVAKAKIASEAVDAPRASYSRSDWSNLSPADRALFDRIMPWLFDGRTPIHTPAEYIALHNEGVRKIGKKAGAWRKVPAGRADWLPVPVSILPFQETEDYAAYSARMRAAKAA